MLVGECGNSYTCCILQNVLKDEFCAVQFVSVLKKELAATEQSRDTFIRDFSEVS